MNFTCNAAKLMFALVVACWLLCPAPVFAQSENSNTAASPTAPKKPAKSQNPAGQADDDQQKPAKSDPKAKGDQKAGKKGDAKPKSADDDGDDESGGTMNPKAAQKKILLEETKYRERMAKISRLRELASEQGNQERLAALDKLQAKTTELHERKIARARAALSDEEFAKLEGELKKGRGKGKANKDEKPHGKPASPGKSDDAKGNNKQNDDKGNAAAKGKSGDSKSNTGKPDDKGKPGKSEGNGKGKKP